MLREFVTSKKVLAALLTVVAQLVFKDPDLRTRVLELGMVLIGAIAVADHGRAKADAVAGTTIITAPGALSVTVDSGPVAAAPLPKKVP